VALNEDNAKEVALYT